MLNRIPWLAVFLFLVHAIHAQEKLGIANSNYHPVSSIHLNASSSVDSRTYMQLNLVGVNAFVMNNAAFLPQFSFWRFLNTKSAGQTQLSDLKMRKFLFANLVADGPAFILSKKNFGIGLFVRARSVLDARRIPYELTELLLNNRLPDVKDQTSQLNMRNAKISNMSWAEYGLNFGLMAYKREFNLITVGGNLKYLTGINLVYVNINRLDALYNSSMVSISGFEGRSRNVSPAFGSGKGYGLDLGVTYKKMLSHVDSYMAHSKSSHCNYIDYKYKLGLSMRDLGYIRFGNSSRTELAGNGNFYTAPNDSSYQSMLAANFSVETVDGVPTTASLPTALSAQFDYNFENSLYLNLTVNKSVLPNSVTGVQSSDLFSIAPRFETRQFEVAAPLTFQRFIYPQIGLAFRLRSFVLGFDNVLPFLIRKNTYGVNVYFNLAISLFKNPACGGSLKKIDDCPSYKSGKRKNRRMNSLLSPRPRRK